MYTGYSVVTQLGLGSIDIPNNQMHKDFKTIWIVQQ